MTLYRSFPYYILLSLFFIALVITLDSYQLLNSFFDYEKILKQSKELTPSQEMNNTLLEIADSSTLNLENPFFLANKESGGGNQSLNNDVLNSIIEKKGSGFSEMDEGESRQEKKDEQEDFQLNEKANVFIPPSINQEKNNLLNKQKMGSAGQTVSIFMDDNGNLSVNSMSLKEADYLIRTAKNIFNYWIEFIPGAMIYYGYVKKNEEGYVQGIIRFKKEGVSYNMSIETPFDSRIMNQTTKNAFRFYKIPFNKKINLESIRVELKIYKDTLRISGQFEFEIK